MYQPNQSHPSTQGYTSPPYRGSPVPQPGPGYQAFSPSPPPNAFSPMSSGHSQRFQQPYASSPPNTGHYPRQSRYAGQQGYGQSQQQRPAQGPPPSQGQGQPKYKGTLAPGTIVQVEGNQVRVERYLSEGGYAHVYLTQSEKAIYPPKKGDKWDKGFTQHCLKRIAFEDDSVWTDVKKEIEVMKALPPNPHLVQYLGSSHTRTSKGGHEVFILMEFCAGGGIIDLLNKRLRDRLKEAEILNIFTDVCEAVAAMHALKSPLLHRDLKIENVLSTPGDQSRSMGLIFKLCDFGSTTFPAAHPPSSKVEADAQAMDLNRHTTLQYRSPEMVEPMLGLAVGLPSDVWALGVLLYKLCYYTTPFEEHGTLAIVNAKYSFPQYPVYSPRIQHLIASMLMEQPSRRPTVFDILRVSHEMSGTRPTIDYPASVSKQLPPQPRAPTQQRPTSSNPNLLDYSSKSPPPNSFAQMNPNIQPQRRGRPTRDSLNSKQGPLPTPPTIPTTTSTVPPRARLQVTGDRSSPKPQPQPKAPTPSGSVDAFGLPTAPRPQGSTSSGFSDSFGSNSNPTQKAFRPTSRFGRGLSNNSNSGFGDSFNSPPTPKADVDRLPASRLEIPKTTSPTTTTQTNNTDQTFESRYPSIETLSGDSSTPHLISPLTSPPPMTSRPSMLGNMTGGDLKQPHQHLAVKTGGPQPRSTHVTGTAFARSPSPIKARAEYFENQSVTNGNGNGIGKKEVDLMTGEEDEVMGAPLIRRASSTFHHPPSETREGGRTPTRQEPDSSDEDEGPESVTPAPHSVPSNTYKPIEDTRSPPTNEYKPLEEPRSATLPPKDEMPSNIRSRSPSPKKQRPQTMYGYPSTSPDKSSTSPTKPSGGLPTPQPRPGHVRKGSINDIVSKFEGLNPPSNNDRPISKPKVKPTITTKPAQLKKPTLDTVRAEGLQSPIIPTSAPSRGMIPPKPQKPITSSRNSTTTSNSRNEIPKSDEYKSSSGRSFPIVKPKPKLQVQDAPRSEPVVEIKSGGSSPDKQQSVNSLVARWNQGEMVKKPVVKPKPVLP